MKHKLLHLALLLISLCLWQCGPQNTKDKVVVSGETATETAEKDLNNFRLPERVNQQAPMMQQHIYKLLPVLTPSFKLKPSFVLAEEDDSDLSEMIRGQTDVMVTRLNMLHLAYYKDGWINWSGTVLLGVGRGVGLQTRAGYEIMLNLKDKHIRLEFKDGETTLSERFHYDTDHEANVELEGRRLYINYFTIPEETMKRMGN